MPDSASQFDVIVIGSGTSGGISSYILQNAGARVLLLEAGKHYTADDFPLPEWQYSPKLYWGGGLEYNTRCDLAFLRGRCVGGSSVINQALMDRFDDVALDDWRAESGIDFFTEEAMAPHYDFAEQNMTLQTIPAEWRNKNAVLFTRGLDNEKLGWKPLRRAQSDCATEEGNDCICCLGGCHRNSKQSTLAGYVPRAVEKGLTLVSEFFVRQIEHHSDGVTIIGERHGQQMRYRAPKAILACGALGNTQLLLNSGFKKRLPALGRGFCMHPQYMNFAVFDELIDAHKGALQGVSSHDDGLRKRGFKLENVYAPPISLGVLSGKSGVALHQFLAKYRHFACMEVCIRDENTGTIETDRKGKLRVDKKLTDQDMRRVDDGFACVQRIFESLQPREVQMYRWGFGLHLMGGCPMGLDAKNFVVGPDFRLHGHPNLYAADSSVFPNAPGINPGLTIYALGHRMASSIAQGN